MIFEHHDIDHAIAHCPPLVDGDEEDRHYDIEHYDTVNNGCSLIAHCSSLATRRIGIMIFEHHDIDHDFAHRSSTGMSRMRHYDNLTQHYDT